MTLPVNQICRVYYNINQKLLSVQTRTEEGWRVLTHVQSIVLENARFIVSSAGRDRVRQEKRKNVHAFIQGTCVEDTDSFIGTPVTYNPYKHDTFVRLDTNVPIQYCDRVVIEGNKIRALLT